MHAEAPQGRLHGSAHQGQGKPPLDSLQNETCIQCVDAPPSQNNEIVPLTVSVTGDFRDSENNFGYRYYKDPVIWAIYPSYGPKNG